MKKIELDDELYQYIAAQTQNIGESASQILRRLLFLPSLPNKDGVFEQPTPTNISKTVTEVVDSKTPINVAKVEEPAKKTSESIKHADKALSDATALQALLEGKELAKVEHSVERFLLMLSVMYQDSPEAFARASETTRGRKRLYLAQSETALEEGGKTCKPRAIADTPFWVITNANNGRKRIIIAQLMASMGYAHHVIEKACAKI